MQIVMQILRSLPKVCTNEIKKMEDTFCTEIFVDITLPQITDYNYLFTMPV